MISCKKSTIFHSFYVVTDKKCAIFQCFFVSTKCDHMISIVVTTNFYNYIHIYLNINILKTKNDKNLFLSFLEKLYFIGCLFYSLILNILCMISSSGVPNTSILNTAQAITNSSGCSTSFVIWLIPNHTPVISVSISIIIPISILRKVLVLFVMLLDFNN